MMIKIKRYFSLVLAVAVAAAMIPASVSYGETEEPEPSDREVVELNEDNFPDANFRRQIEQLVDGDNDGWLSEDEISWLTNLQSPNAENYTGIEYFTNLDSLIIKGSKATKLDISNNTELIELFCDDSRLESLDVSANKKLETLDAKNTDLETLNIGDLPKLSDLQISDNPFLETLTLGSLPQLETLNVDNDERLKMLNLSGANRLTTLQAAGCDLESVTFAADNLLKTVKLDNNSRLASVDFSGSADLERLEITNCALTNLDLSQNLQLSTLKCDYNKLRSLTVAKAQALTEITCTNNELACLNLEYSPAKITASSNVYPIELNADNTFDLASIPGYDVTKLDKSGISKGSVVGSVLTLPEKDATIGTTIICPYECAAQSTNSALSTIRFQLKVVGKKTEPEPPVDPDNPPVDPDNPPEPPAAPKNVSAALYGYDDIAVRWSKVSGASGYKVYYRKSSSGTWTYKGRKTGSTCSIPNLAGGVKYYIKVVPFVTFEGKDLAGSAGSTSIYTLKKVGTPVVKKYSGSKVKVSWANINGESGYQISRATKKSGTNIVVTYKTTTGKSKVINAKKGKTYYYKVRAYRTVNGKKIYAPWSGVRAYKIK